MHDEILNFIKEFLDEQGYAPSYRDIARGVNLSSTSQVSQYIDDLVEEGKLVREPGIARSLRLA
jgi:repressor LexA